MLVKPGVEAMLDEARHVHIRHVLYWQQLVLPVSLLEVGMHVCACVSVCACVCVHVCVCVDTAI